MSKTEHEPDKTLAEPPKTAAAADSTAEGESADNEEYHSRIVIRPDGEVVIENLSMDLLELAMMLDPESEVACEIPGLAPAPTDDKNDDDKDQGS